MKKIFCLLCSICCLFLYASYHQQQFEQFKKSIDVPVEYESIIQTLYQQLPEIYEYNVVLVDNALFRKFPSLKLKLPYVALAQLPTLIRKCDGLSLHYDTEFYIKDDSDTAGPLFFGGNKVRKLEFLLGDALANNAKSVITFGCVGSNHALATACCAQRVGLQCSCMLKPQYNSAVVQRNLLLHTVYGSDVHYSPDNLIHALATTAAFVKHIQNDGNIPYVIPTGGSCARGCLGYVNAALELEEQLQTGVMPVPDVTYVTLGSGGTVAGLLLGLKLAERKLPLQCIVISLESQPGNYEKLVQRLFRETNDLLRSYDASIPEYVLQQEDYEIVHAYAGTGYGIPTEVGEAAKELLLQQEYVHLDSTYTAKTAAAVLEELASQSYKTVLFWNTFCGRDFSEILGQADSKRLPAAVKKYFEE